MLQIFHVFVFELSERNEFLMKKVQKRKQIGSTSLKT